MQMIKQLALISLLAMLIVSNCSTKTLEPGIDCLHRIDLAYRLDMVLSDGELVHVIDTVKVYFNSDIMIYALPYFSSFHYETELISLEKKYTYFLCKKKEVIGCYADSIESRSFRPVKIDSTLRERAFLGIEILNDSLYGFLSSEYIASDTLKEIYTPFSKSDASYLDSIFIYYSSPIPHFDYSFSSKLELEKRKKVIKAELVYNEYFDSSYNVKVPPRVLKFELIREEVDEPDKLSALILHAQRYCLE